MITTSTILTTQYGIAICDNHDINNNHLTRFLTKEINSDEFIIQNDKNNTIHLKKFTKPLNSFLEWGMHINGKNPSQNNYFENITIKTVKFSSNVQLALDIDGNLYCKYNNVTQFIFILKYLVFYKLMTYINIHIYRMIGIK